MSKNLLKYQLKTELFQFAHFIYLEYGGISNGKLCIDVPIFIDES